MGSIRFSSEMPTWVVVIAAIATAGAVLVYYLRETQYLETPANFLIPSLRAAAVALMIVVLAGPIWHREVTVGTLGRVVFVTDQSGSMSSADTTLDQNRFDLDDDSVSTRMDRVHRLLDGQGDSEGWVEQLSQTHHVEVLPFSKGNQTDIGSALSAVSGLRTESDPGSSRSGPKVQSAVVIFSDGRNNAGPSPTAAAASLLASGTVVHTIGIGSMDEPPGMGIADVEHPASVTPDGSLVGRIKLTQSKKANQKAMVRIETASGDSLWEKQVVFGVSSGQSVGFEIDVETALAKIDGEGPADPDQTGINRSTMVMNLRAVVDGDGEDWINQNNSFPFRVAAATRQRRLLILDGGSRWEMRYLKNLFQRDPGWSVNTVLFGIGTDNPRLLHGNGDRDGDANGDANGDGRYPNSQEAMGKYDAVILGEIPAEFFDEQDAQQLKDFVNRGGGLIVIDGQYGQIDMLAQNQLTDLIPVRHDEATTVKPKLIQLNSLGREQPMMNLFGETDQLEELWGKLPAPVTTNVVTPGDAAEVWAETVDAGGTRLPWLVTHLFGGGRVFYFASDQTWRWRYKVADRLHARFWNQVMEAVMQPPYSASDEYLAVGTDLLEYESGGKPIIRVRLQDASGSPIGNATVDALLVSQDQIIATVPLVIDDTERGTYQGQALGLPDGEYQIRIRASGFDQTALRATTPIWVGENGSAEWNRISVDDQSLMSIATAGGGEYRHESSADEILNRLEVLSTGRIVESDISLWQSFYWFWAVLGLLTTEWILRKRSGLV